jgi:putative hydrolase of the HAD superfamily
VTQGLVVFDGDDTLWKTEFLYDQARDEAAALVAASGIDPSAFKDLQRKIDVQNVKHFGLSRDRFPTSSVQAYEDLARRHLDTVSDQVARDVYQASASVFTRPAPLVDGVVTVLESLSRRFELALLTKGDLRVQEKRIEDSGLRPLFRDIQVVPDKDAAAFKYILDCVGVTAENAWSVGNSMRSDILPALEVGMRAVWVDAYVWAHERHEDEALARLPGIHIATTLAMVPTIIDDEAAQRPPEA